MRRVLGQGANGFPSAREPANSALYVCRYMRGVMMMLKAGPPGPGASCGSAARRVRRAVRVESL